MAFGPAITLRELLHPLKLACHPIGIAPFQSFECLKGMREKRQTFSLSEVIIPYYLLRA
jgi:hypothetical protein